MSLSAALATEQNASYRDICWPLPSQRVHDANRRFGSGTTSVRASPVCMLRHAPAPSVFVCHKSREGWETWTHWVEPCHVSLASGAATSVNSVAPTVSTGKHSTESATISATDAWIDSALVEVLEAGIGEIEARYSLRDAPTVRQYLRDYPEVIEVLIEARPHLEEHFGTEVRVSLEVINDPEAAEIKELFAYIATDLSADEAVMRLDAFDEGWFLHYVDRVAGRLNFNLEFT